MEYRLLGRTGLKVSAISMGTEYLINQDRARVVDVIHAAIDAGVNYFDTFFAQPNFRDHMSAAYRGKRQGLILTAHLGAIEENGQYMRTREVKPAEQSFLDYLRRLDVDGVDVLYLHNCDPQSDYDTLMRPDGLLGLAQRLQKEGKARFIAYSGHNTVTAQQAVQSGFVDLIMFPINFTNHVLPGRLALLEACVHHNVGLVVMKPFAGGNLLRDTSQIAIEDYQMGRAEMPGAPLHLQKPAKITPVQCLAYVLDQPGVSTIVPGCKNLEELAQVRAYWQAPAAEKDYAGLLGMFAALTTGECVHCNHCLPCPARIDIGATLKLLEQARQGVTAALREAYLALPARASECLECGDCEVRCPFGVKVIPQMNQAALLFEA